MSVDLTASNASLALLEQSGEVDMKGSSNKKKYDVDDPDKLNMIQRISQKRDLEKNQFLRSKPILKDVLKSSDYNNIISSPLNVFK